MGFPNGHGADFGSGCNRKELANLVKGYLAYGLGTISVNDHIASSVHAQELALVLRFTGGDDHLTAQDAIQAAEWYVAWGKALPHLERVRDILGNHLVAAHDLDLRLQQLDDGIYVSGAVNMGQTPLLFANSDRLQLSMQRTGIPGNLSQSVETIVLVYEAIKYPTLSASASPSPVPQVRTGQHQGLGGTVQ